jgi:PIF1-like helicase
MKMQGHKIIFHSADSLESDEEGVCSNVPGEFLCTVDPTLLPLLELKVKLGCPLMLLWNLDPGKGLCNGTRMILPHAYSRFLKVMIISGDH